MTLYEAGKISYARQRYEIFVRRTPEQPELSSINDLVGRPLNSETEAEAALSEIVERMNSGALPVIEVVLLGPNGYMKSARKE